MRGVMKSLFIVLLAACGPGREVKLEDTLNGDGVADSSGTEGNGTDADQDGYPAEEDCDDNNPAINPSNSPTWFADTDQDDHGNPNDSVVACSPPTGYVASSGDCNDQDPTINPPAEEICDG